MASPADSGPLPSIIVTGASGFIGSHFLEAARDSFIIHAVARRTQKAAGVQFHPNIRWIPADIGDRARVERLTREIARSGGVDYVLHLAGYYDFTNQNHREYVRTNVEGTRNVLECVRRLSIKRFIFASSLTVTDVTRGNVTVDEEAPADATFPYAVSKTRGEELVRGSAEHFPVSIVRQAAIFSDWCQYGPLYVFLSTWLSRRWHRKILAGQGRAAIPYLHINDLIRLFMAMIRASDELPRQHVCVASPDGCSSQRQLFELAGRYNYFHAARPWLLPRTIAHAGVIVRDLWGQLNRKRPFERSWMLKYTDRQLDVDASRTRRELDWQPTPRLSIERRLLFLIENMKSNPHEWHRRNQEVFHRSRTQRPNLRIYETMVMLREWIIHDIYLEVRSDENAQHLPSYQALDPAELTSRVEYIYKMVENDIRTGDRRYILNYARELARARYEEGFESGEVIRAVGITADCIMRVLLSEPRMRRLEQSIHDEISLTLQLVADEVEDTFEKLLAGAAGARGSSTRETLSPVGDRAPVNDPGAPLPSADPPTTDPRSGTGSHPGPARPGRPARRAHARPPPESPPRRDR